ncbi:MAG: hypothetical protein RIT22_1289 [Bacteroidota bacterium]|jgi:hypothetical protein
MIYLRHGVNDFSASIFIYKLESITERMLFFYNSVGLNENLLVFHVSIA